MNVELGQIFGGRGRRDARDENGMPQFAGVTADERDTRGSLFFLDKDYSTKADGLKNPYPDKALVQSSAEFFGAYQQFRNMERNTTRTDDATKEQLNTQANLFKYVRELNLNYVVHSSSDTNLVDYCKGMLRPIGSAFSPMQNAQALDEIRKGGDKDRAVYKHAPEGSFFVSEGNNTPFRPIYDRDTMVFVNRLASKIWNEPEKIKELSAVARDEDILLTRDPQMRDSLLLMSLKAAFPDEAAEIEKETAPAPKAVKAKSGKSSAPVEKAEPSRWEALFDKYADAIYQFLDDRVKNIASASNVVDDVVKVTEDVSAFVREHQPAINNVAPRIEKHLETQPMFFGYKSGDGVNEQPRSLEVGATRNGEVYIRSNMGATDGKDKVFKFPKGVSAEARKDLAQIISEANAIRNEGPENPRKPGSAEQLEYDKHQNIWYPRMIDAVDSLLDEYQKKDKIEEKAVQEFKEGLSVSANGMSHKLLVASAQAQQQGAGQTAAATEIGTKIANGLFGGTSTPTPAAPTGRTAAEVQEMMDLVKGALSTEQIKQFQGQLKDFETKAKNGVSIVEATDGFIDSTNISGVEFAKKIMENVKVEESGTSQTPAPSGSTPSGSTSMVK
ncbi:MAG: hypothetical protein COV36_01090 [Alphaproteobacteria bacterium CG11_big_fil_rev_8_21_14_0_20_44_7]|nr:MAG: hypothetical protein COV36_01090 [Alphaproteobacteria bacterium CG11_big_fil_rev_8_21_14_0_20_44_7]